MDGIELPADVVLVRTTDEWDEESLPDGLRRAHRVAEGVWGRLVVRAGALRCTFEDDGAARVLGPGEAQVLPPGRAHHVEPTGTVRFVIEFHRAPPST